MNKSLSDLKVALDYAQKMVETAPPYEVDKWVNKVNEIQRMIDESVNLLVEG